MTKWPTKLTDLIVELPIIEDATCDAMVDWFEQNKVRQVTGAVGEQQIKQLILTVVMLLILLSNHQIKYFLG